MPLPLCTDLSFFLVRKSPSAIAIHSVVITMPPEWPDGACKAPCGWQRMQNGLQVTQGPFIDTWKERTLQTNFSSMRRLYLQSLCTFVSYVTEFYVLVWLLKLKILSIVLYFPSNARKLFRNQWHGTLSGLQIQREAVQLVLILFFF